MNIFVLSSDPREAAQFQCDKHAVKMVTESAQMLSTAHRILDGILIIDRSAKRLKRTYRHPSTIMDSDLYKVAHPKHPCTIWTMESKANYQWHYEHFTALCDEYTHRYGKVHMSDAKLRALLSQCPTNIIDKGLTRFPLAMQSEPQCIHPDDPVRSYREFYHTKKNRFKMVWTNRQKPEWFEE